jgi:hypothetical protein
MRCLIPFQRHALITADYRVVRAADILAWGGCHYESTARLDLTSSQAQVPLDT